MDEGQVNCAIGCAWKVVERKGFAFRFFPDVGGDDLVQEALRHVHQSFWRFDAGLGSFSHFATMIAERKISNALRDRYRKANQDAIYAALLPDEDEGRDDGFAELAASIDADGVAPLALCDWLGSICRAVKRTLGANPKHRKGRRFFNVGQVVAAGFLATRFNLAPAATRQAFLDDPDLARAVFRFQHVPSESWFKGVPDVCTSIFSKFRGEQREAFRLLLEFPLVKGNGPEPGE